MPPKREIQVRFLLAVPTPAPFATQRGLFFAGRQFKCLPARQSGRLFAQGANGRLGPTPPDALDLAQPKRTGACSRRPLFTTSGRAGAALPRAFPMRTQPDAMTRKPCPPPGQEKNGSELGRIVGWAEARFITPLFFFPPPLCLSLHFAPPHSFYWTLRVCAIDGMPSSARPGLAQATSGRRRLTIDLAQRLGARRRRVSRAAFANQQRRQTRRTKPPSARTAPLWRSPSDPLRLGRRSTPGGLPQAPRFPTRSDDAWARGGAAP